MIKFDVSANTIEQEVELIWDKIKNYNFFLKHNYSLSLPNHKTIQKLINKSVKSELSQKDYDELFKTMESEIYNVKNYQNGLNKIHFKLDNIELSTPFFEEYNKIWNFKFFEKYFIKLTLYGPGGEYRPSTGTVIMLTTQNGNFRRGLNPLETIIHEMVHIGIEEAIIQKFKISHIVKEQIVDLFVKFHFKDILPKYVTQNFGENRIKEFLKSKENWLNLERVINEYCCM